MQIESKDGNMVLNYYPTKGRDNIINTDQFLKKVISTQDYINEVYDRIHKFKYVDNNVDHSNLHQFVSLKEV